MKKSTQSRRGVPDAGPPAPPPPEKVGWIRKFCGRGIFRELWRSRYAVLRGDGVLYVSDKEVRAGDQEVFDLADYERSEELRKPKSRSKKNHSRFTLLRRRLPGNAVPNLVFLAVSPEEKESWVNALNAAIVKARNRVLDEVTIEEDGALVHPTRDRAKIPPGRRLPTRGHLMAVASTSSHGMLTLDLVAEEDDGDPRKSSWEDLLLRGGSCGQVAAVGSSGVGGRQRAGTDVSKLRAASKEPKVKTSSLPRGSELSWGRQSHLEASKGHNTQQSLTPPAGTRIRTGRSRCASMDEVLSSRPAMIRSEFRSALRRCPTEEEAGGGGAPVQLQSLIAQRMQRAQELLEEMRLQELQKAPYLKGIDSPRLHHLRGPESPHASRSPGSPRSRSSDSPRLRGKDSPRPPRLRGRESPRSKAKRTRSKGTDSPRSRGSHSPAAKATDSPRLKDSPRTKTSDTRSPKPKMASCSASCPKDDDSAAQKTPKSAAGAGGRDTSPVEDAESRQGLADLPRPDQNSPSVSGSFEPSQPKTPNETRPGTPPASPPTTPESDLRRRREEAERLLEEAVSSWKEAQEVLQEVKELQSQTMRRQRRRTYEKMALTAAAAGLPMATAAAAAADEDDTPNSATSPEDESETP